MRSSKHKNGQPGPPSIDAKRRLCRYWKAHQQQRIQELAKTLQTSLQASANKCHRLQAALVAEKEAHAATMQRMERRFQQQHPRTRSPHQSFPDEEEEDSGSSGDDDAEDAITSASASEDEEEVYDEE